MKALVIGATGATGKPLVEELLKDSNYTEVVVFVRHSTGITDSKLTEFSIDFSNIEAFSEKINGDVLFCCMGTTLKAAGSKEAQIRIDYEMPLKFAEIAKQNGVSSFVLISAANANAQSNIFYSRIKGQLEEEIASLSFQQYIIFRPGMLQRPNSDRFFEKMTVDVLKFVNRMGILKKLRPLPTTLLAQKMAIAPQKLPQGVSIISFDEIFSF